ncbi:universal stress protein family protein [Kribbella orskensis]|uniref:Universal stress protein family protein n=1 Tax=Kribbella orskensis TaxID=2512216 RepID=A0ABY2B6D0_9ACTN|nr:MULTISPECIES: universal stress protein [Kribbella]TCN26925.1 universal stress protein family protein [Kribbella sp. VKM Ac-2500]TCO07393.1 universal stress protein family protein [Kribbella orskensis]
MASQVRSGPVVVEVDGAAEGLRVIDYACLEALRSGADLVLVNSSGTHSTSSMRASELPKPPGEVADAWLRVAAGHVRHRYRNGLQLGTVSKEGARADVLAEAARNARLLIVGRTPKRGPQRLQAAQANLNLAARVGCPVLVVPLSWRPSAIDRKVAVGVDGSALSAEAVEFAFLAAAERGGDLTVVRAGLPPDHAGNDEDVDHSWLSRADLSISEAVAAWIGEFPEVKVTRYLSSRPAAEVLVRESADVGLMVVGAHDNSLSIPDPVARRCVAAMTCPVAIVPHRLTAAVGSARGAPPAPCRATEVTLGV